MGHCAFFSNSCNIRSLPPSPRCNVGRLFGKPFLTNNIAWGEGEGGGGGKVEFGPKERLFPCERLIDGRGSASCKRVPHNFGQDCSYLASEVRELRCIGSTAAKLVQQTLPSPPWSENQVDLIGPYFPNYPSWTADWVTHVFSWHRLSKCRDDCLLRGLCRWTSCVSLWSHSILFRSVWRTPCSHRGGRVSGISYAQTACFWILGQGGPEWRGRRPCSGRGNTAFHGGDGVDE